MVTKEQQLVPVSHPHREGVAVGNVPTSAQENVEASYPRKLLITNLFYVWLFKGVLEVIILYGNSSFGKLSHRKEIVFKI